MEGSDADLVRAVLGGDRTAFAGLYDRYAPVVRAICYDHTRNLAHAQDLTQAVFLKAYCKLGQLRDPDQFAAWLVGIARNECRDWLRRRSRDRHEFVERLPEVAAGGPADDEEQRSIAPHRGHEPPARAGAAGLARLLPAGRIGRCGSGGAGALGFRRLPLDRTGAQIDSPDCLMKRRRTCHERTPERQAPPSA